MKSLLGDFEKIKEDFIKKEIIYAIGCSPHSCLSTNLEDMLKNN